MTIGPDAGERILVIKLRGVGDVLFSTIVIANLRQAFPDGRIDYLTEPPSADVIRGNPHVSEIVVFDRRKESGAGLIRKIRGRRYTMVIDLFGNPRTAMITRLSGATYRVGFRFRFRTYAYNVVVEPRGGIVHNTQFNLDALEAIGVAIHDRNLYFPMARSDAAFADSYFREKNLDSRIVAAINTSGGWYTKRWDIGRFAELADKLATSYGAAILATWGPSEKDDAEQLLRLMKQGGHLAPPTTLKQLGAILKRCSFVVSNDSGPMHLAAAVGTPVLGIYGPTNPLLQGPYGANHGVIRNETLDCLGCNLTECPIGHPCMKELSVETVAQAARNLMLRNKLIV